MLHVRVSLHTASMQAQPMMHPDATDVDRTEWSELWKSIPGDVMGRLLSNGLLDHRDAQCIMRTCVQWRAAAKRQLSELSPLYIGPPCSVEPSGFPGAQTLRCRSLRARGFIPKHLDSASSAAAGGGGDTAGEGGRAGGPPDRGGSVACGAPPPHLYVWAPPIGELAGALQRAPALTSVDLSGHALPPGAGAALGALRALRELRLRSCGVAAKDLLELLVCLQGGAPGGGGSGGGSGGSDDSGSCGPHGSERRAAGAPAGLRLLGIADLRVRDAPEGSALAEEVAKVGLPPSLHSLDASLFLRPRDPAPRPHGRLALHGWVDALVWPLRRSLRSLALLEQQLGDSDLQALCGLTRLKDLSISWWPSGPPAAAVGRLSRLSSLACLKFTLHGQGGFHEPLSLGGLTGLRELELSGCRSLPLALSVMGLARLERLAMSSCGEAVSANVVAQIIRCTPELQELSLKAMALNQELRTPGDEILFQLAACCPRLRVLRLDDTAAHGVGLRRPAWAAPAGGRWWLRGLQDLDLCGSQLLRSSLLHLSALESLTSLALHAAPPSEFAHAARLGCFKGLSQLSRTLRVLRVTGCAGSPAPGAPGAAAAAAGAGGAAGGGATAGPQALAEPHLHFLAALTALEHLELGVLHTSGACLSHLAGLSRLESLHCGGSLRFDGRGLAVLGTLRLPRLQTLSLVDIPGGSGADAGWPASTGGSYGGTGDRGGSPARRTGALLPAALSVLRALPPAAPALRNLRLGSCCGVGAGALAAALAALPTVEVLQLQELPLTAAEVCEALGPAVAAGLVSLIAMDVRSREDIASMRAASAASAALVAAAAAGGGGDMLNAAAGHMAVQAAAAAVGHGAAWPAPAAAMAAGNAADGGGAAAGQVLLPGWLHGAPVPLADGVLAMDAAGAPPPDEQGGPAAAVRPWRARGHGREYSYGLARCGGRLVDCRAMASALPVQHG